MANKNQLPASLWPERLERLGIASLGLVLISLPLFFWIGTQDQFELPKLTVLRLLSTVTIGCWTASQALSPSWRWRRTPLDLPLLLWSLWLIVKTVNSVSSSVSWRGEYENFAGSLTQLNYSLLFWAAVQFVRKSDSARRLLLCFEFATVSVGMYAIFQALGMDFVSWASNTVVQQRYFASMGNPNFLGALMIMGLALVIARAMQRFAPPRALWWQWIFLASLPLAWLCIYQIFPLPGGHNFNPSDVIHQGQKGALWAMGLYLVMLIVLAVLIKAGKARLSLDLVLGMEGLVLFKSLADTGTRGAFAGLLATLGFFAVLALARQWQRMRAEGRSASSRTLITGGTLAVLFVALTVASFVMGPELRIRMVETLSHPLQAFDASRLNIWGPAWNIAKANPISGTGVDTFKTVFPQYSYSRFAHFDGDNVASRTAHCEPLQVLSTMGTVGLALWFWLLGAWVLAWWRRYQITEKSEAPWLIGIGGLFVGYLVQNLVSFGVSAITAPFFLCMGMLWADQEASPWYRKSFGFKGAMLALCGMWLILGAWLSTTAFRADELYGFGNMVISQNKILENAPLGDCRSAAFYALNELDAYKAVMRDEQAKEEDYWIQGLREQESSPKNSAAEEQAAQPFYSQASRALLLVLSTLKQERAVQLCPSEVKYQVFLGLAYEELFKLSAVPALRETWFSLAEATYTRGSAMNPRNAYYHGNLARLYSIKAEQGQHSFIALSENQYLQAVALAPSTKLFYENLILLYAQNGMPEPAFKLLAPLEAREPDMAGQLYMAVGSTFYQWSQSLHPSKEQMAQLAAASLKALDKASVLDPTNPDVDYLIGAIYFDQKDRKMAKTYMLKALALKPDYDIAEKFIQANRL